MEEAALLLLYIYNLYVNLHYLWKHCHTLEAYIMPYVISIQLLFIFIYSEHPIFL